MSWNKASKFDLLTIEGLPLRPSDQEYKSCFSSTSKETKTHEMKPEVHLVIALPLPQNRSFDKVLVQVCCFYAHAHIPVPRLLQKEQIRRENFPISIMCSTSEFLHLLGCQWKMYASTFVLPSDLADSMAKCNMMLAIPWRRADLATHKFAI